MRTEPTLNYHLRVCSYFRGGNQRHTNTYTKTNPSLGRSILQILDKNWIHSESIADSCQFTNKTHVQFDFLNSNFANGMSWCLFIDFTLLHYLVYDRSRPCVWEINSQRFIWCPDAIVKRQCGRLWHFSGHWAMNLVKCKTHDVIGIVKLWPQLIKLIHSNGYYKWIHLKILFVLCECWMNHSILVSSFRFWTTFTLVEWHLFRVPPSSTMKPLVYRAMLKSAIAFAVPLTLEYKIKFKYAIFLKLDRGHWYGGETMRATSEYDYKLSSFIFYFIFLNFLNLEAREKPAFYGVSYLAEILNYRLMHSWTNADIL